MRDRSSLAAAALLVALLLVPPSGIAEEPPHHRTADEAPVLAPGYSALAFPAPLPGTYELPPLGPAADGTLLDSSGNAVTLHELFDGKTVVLSFVYTTCPDVNGCPLATFVLGQVQRRLAADPAMRSRVRLVTVSFDPINDTPDVMEEYGRHFVTGAVDWRFLTAASQASLDPVLERYDQSVIRSRGADGTASSTISHILRVYLIDADKRIRNIYSPSFLHADVLSADIRTVTDAKPAR